jgi:putative flippase GtrA
MTSASRGTEIRRLVVFGAVGTVNTALCYALFVVLVHTCAWHYNLALAFDYAFGIVLGYALHRSSTFADQKHLHQAFSKYTITLVATFLANLAMLDVIVRWRLLEPLPGQAVAMLTVTLGSYLVQKHWVFRSRVEADSAPLVLQTRTTGSSEDRHTRRAA